MSEAKQDRPKRVFISATTHDLKSYRKAVTQWARDKNYDPIVQDEFPTHSDYYTVRTLLRDKISLCDAVIHLAGLYYGAEPAGNTSSESRRSYTQLEYDVSRALRKQIITLIADEKYQPDNSIENQSPDLAELQRDHRSRIKANKGMYYSFRDIPSLLDRLENVVITDSIAKPSNLPAVGALFKGRDKFLEQLRSKVENKVGSALVIATKQTIHGLGGIGKTRLAIEYANRYSEHYNALLFVVADSPENLRANIANLCVVLGIYEPEPAKQYHAAIKWLQEHPGWILIVDSVNTQEAAKEVAESILSKLKAGHIVVTSRLSTWKNRGLDALQLDVISQEASVDLLLEGTQDRRKVKPSEQEDAINLSKRLGYLPLALQQAVGFIVTRRCSFADYLERWEKTDKKVIEWHDELELKYPRSVATTWEMSFEEMKPAGKALLQMICWLASDPIPRTLLDKVPQKPDPVDIEEGMAELEKYSFLQWVDNDSDSVQIHGLVSEIARYRMSQQEQLETVEKSLTTMNFFVANHDPSDPRTWPTIFEPVRAHLGKLTEVADRMDIQNLTSFLMDKLGIHLFAIGEFKEAEPLLRRALAIDEDSYGPDHPNVAKGLSRLARLLLETNRISEAEPIGRRTLAIDEYSYGLDHPSVAMRLNNLGVILNKTNRHSEAESLYKRALRVAEAFYGSDHPNVAAALGNLAGLLRETNRHSEAEILHRRALAIDEASYGPDHPNVAIGLGNLANLLQETNRHSEAELLKKRALAIDEASYGPDHPNVARGLNNLASLLQETNRHSEAELLQKRALAIDEASYGSDHPNVAIGLNNLACLLQDTYRYSEAEHLFRRALRIDEASYGPDHPNVARRLSNLAGLLTETNRHSEAERLFLRALMIEEASYGPDHPNVARVLNNIALLLQDTSRYSEAEPLQRRALAIYKTSYGPDHPNVAIGLNNLALLLQGTNRYSEAERLFKRAIRIKEGSYGPVHPDVAAGLNNLASLLQEINRHSEAEPLTRRALSIDEASYGPDHPKFARGLNNLALLLQDTNRHSEAEPLQRRALAIYKTSYGSDHPNVARLLNNLACTLQETKRHGEAEPLFRRALLIDEASYGPDHPNVARGLNNLALLLMDTNRHSDAEPLFQRLLKIFFFFKLKTNAQHPNFKKALLNYTGCLSKLRFSECQIQSKLQELQQEAQRAAAPIDPNP